MKSASIIISHLSSQPQFRVLKQQECYKKYLSLLSKKWQKATAFIYIKEETLFVAITHPGFKQELNYNKDLLIDLLKDLNRYDKNCESMKADKVVIFHSKYHPMPSKKPSYLSVPYYREQAKGTFEMPKDQALKEAFERIKLLVQQCKK